VLQKEAPDVELNGERPRDHRLSLRCGELEAMLIYSMSVSVDGFIADRKGAFGWTAPSEELFRFHLAQVRELGGYLCGRRLYETMLVWETDPTLRDSELGAAFADDARSTASRATPGSPRRRWPRRSLRCSTRPTRMSRSAAPGSAAAFELGLVDELRSFRFQSSLVAARRFCRRSPKTSHWT
jgi:hypothetical protein